MVDGMSTMRPARPPPAQQEIKRPDCVTSLKEVPDQIDAQETRAAGHEEAL